MCMHACVFLWHKSSLYGSFSAMAGWWAKKVTACHKSTCKGKKVQHHVGMFTLSTCCIVAPLSKMVTKCTLACCCVGLSRQQCEKCEKAQNGR